MTRSTVLILSAAALLGCSKGSSNAPSNGPGGPPSGGPGTTTEPQTTGTFNIAAAKAMQYPVRIASAGETVYVTDAQTNQVLGITSGAITTAISGLDKPLGLAVAGDLLYVGNAGRKDVEVYSLGQQKYLRSLGGAGAFQMPNAIAVASDGTVVVADSKQNVVQVYSAAGAHVQTIGSPGSHSGQFLFPSAVAIDDSRIVVGDQGNHRIQIFSRAGQFVSSFGSEVTGGKSREDYRGRFTSIAGVALAGANIYVLDSAHAYVQVLDAAGTCKGFLGSSGSCPSCMKLGLDVTVAADGSVLVTDPENSRVVSLSTELR
jgi:NHL repeat